MGMELSILSKAISGTATNISSVTGIGITPALICLFLCCLVIYKITKKIIHIVFTIIIIAVVFTLINNLMI